MPNFTDNRLYVVGEQAAVDAFVERAHSARPDEEICLGFWEHIPEPPQAELKSQGTDWSNWRQLNWGTRAIYEPTLERVSPETAYYSFATAWSPPRPWVAGVAQLHPDLTFMLSYRTKDPFDRYWRTHVPDPKAPEGQLPFSEGFLLFSTDDKKPAEPP